LRFLNAYGYEYEYFKKLVDGKIDIPENNLEECIKHLRRMNAEKLKTIKAILESF